MMPPPSSADDLSLAAYAKTLRLVGATEPAALPLVGHLEGLQALYATMSAVAPAVPGAADEEWNPLSQRPHVPLPPDVGDELGGEITALKETVDAFTTLAHEMMHVAVWEPFFAGRWRPKHRAAFEAFSLMAEGFCFFYGDVVVTGAVRVRLPDGEFALERRTPSNARFAPVRAFAQAGITDRAKILDVYLAGFSGAQTPLWKPRGKAPLAASMAAQVYDFYVGSEDYLKELHAGIAAFGGWTEFPRRYCSGVLPTFLDGDLTPKDDDLGAYFKAFYTRALPRLASLSDAARAEIRKRRARQMRAYYALQIRWLLSEKLVVARALTSAARKRLLTDLDDYLDQLEKPDAPLARLDAAYEANVRARLLAHDAWVGHRRLIAPRRAGGVVSVFDEAKPAKSRKADAARLQVVTYVVDELTRRLKDSTTVEERTALLAAIHKVTGLAAAPKRLAAALAKAPLLNLWSLPLAAFDPAHNSFRELAFSYQ